MNPVILKIIIGILFLVLVGYGLYLVNQNGYDRCQYDYNKAAQKHENESNNKVEEIQNEVSRRVKEVYNAPITDDGSVSPVLERTLDGLFERHGNTDNK